METISVRVEYSQVVSYALCHNRTPLCQYIEISNPTGQPLHQVQVVCEGEYLAPYRSEELPLVQAGETVRLPHVELVPLAERFLQLTERLATQFTVRVTADGEPVCQTVLPLDLLPYDQWMGTTIMPQSLASFVTPNHPAIMAMLPRAAAVLKESTGTSALTEYQSGNTQDVRHQVAAIFGALHREGIIYRSVPPSYELVGQRITLPHEVLSGKAGNCIELTLLMASILEAAGIHSGVVLMRGHAFLGVWLVNDCCTHSVCDDQAYIAKACSRGIGEMLVLETTHVCNEQASFEEAVRSAEQKLADPSAFHMFVDIHRCRLQHVLPLPMLIQRDGQWTVDAAGVEHDRCLLQVEHHDRYDLSHLREAKSELTKFDIWERKLLDFSLRNSLLNLSLCRRAIQFISFDIDRIEDHLSDGEEYCIESRPDVELQQGDGGRLMRSALQESVRMLVVDGIEHHRVHTYHTEAETQAILKNIYRAARTAIEETGANSLFLSLGTLRWYETAVSDTPRYAPLLLMPVEMVYKKGKYYIRTREEETMLNITLVEFLRQNYDIRIPGLDTLPQDQSGVDVPLVFAAVRDALKEQRRWDVEEECILGTFSFSKFLMWNDVHSHRQQLSQNAVVASLVQSGLTWTPTPLSGDLSEQDRTMSPDSLALPVPIDSSQMAAVIAAGRGDTFILYGPPGTGKSQTITNLIANALYQGKRVLFVAEKMAALSVVQTRLERIGLGAFCLELHSNKTTKRHVLQQLDKALHVTHIVSPAEFADAAQRLFQDRQALIAYIRALHDVDPADGLSLHDCITHYEAAGGQPMPGFAPSSQLDELLRTQGVRAVEQLLGDRLETVMQLVGQPSAHPLVGMRLTRDMLMSGAQLTDRLRQCMETLRLAMVRREQYDNTIQLRDTLLQRNSPELLSLDALRLSDEWRAIEAKWFLPRYFARRSYIDRLRRYNRYINEREVPHLLQHLALYQVQHRDIAAVHAILRNYFGIACQEDVLPPSDTLTRCIETLRRWADNAPRMRDWLHWSEYAELLRQSGMGSVAEALESHPYTAQGIRQAFLRALFRHKAEQRIMASPTLATFEGMLFDERIRHYRQVTEEFQMLTQKELYARLATRVPRVTDSIDSSSEIGLLNRNISNGGRGVSLRDLFDQIPTLLPRLCPCMLMSPMSVAQYLDLEAEKFDLVVFDEASQMPTSEAVGAIARGRALVVVGDPKQMPPTSFFSSSNVDEEDAAIDDMESILEDCRTLEIPSLQLNWHYRSRHESLIAFSNNEYYDGQLITFPSVDDQQAKVQYVPVQGFYDKGGKRSNRAEAEAIVGEIARRLRDPQLCRHSIGVIAFSVVQQALIEDVLQDMLEGDRQLHDAADGMYEPIFVKNLENVQGDERDVILFSIGYGPDRDGRVSMNFGPLNNSGGERRLNVAVSRARHEMLVYSTLHSSQIDLRRTQARGVEGLKHFLEYAETHTLPTAASVAAQHQDSIVAQEIARALRQMGYETRTGIGRSQFRVDVAVCDPQHSDVYRLGILLDGHSYRDTQTTRDREVVQPSVLSSLQWNIMRVWSVDWFCNRERVLSRIQERLRQGAPTPDPSPTPHATFDISTEDVEDTHTAAVEYHEYNTTEAQAQRLSDRELMSRILTAEQPISFPLLCRRVCQLRGQGRVTPTLQQTLMQVAQKHFCVQPDRQSTVLWLTAQDSQEYAQYRTASGRDVLDIPMAEIVNVVRESIREQLALQRDHLTLIAAHKMGFARRGAHLDAALDEALSQLIQAGEIQEQNGKLSLLA